MKERVDFINLFIQEEIYLINENLRSASNPDRRTERKSLANGNTNSKKLLVVTAEPLKKAESDFLFKVFAAVKLKHQDIQLSTTDTSLEDFGTAFFFGTAPQDSSPDLYEKVKIDHCTVVVADSLEDIAQDQQKKKELWTILKECFNPALL